jgi:hypothetical protein
LEVISTGAVAVAQLSDDPLIDAALNLSYETLAELFATELSDLLGTRQEQRPWYWLGKLELALSVLAEAVHENQERNRVKGTSPLGSEGRT